MQQETDAVTETAAVEEAIPKGKTMNASRAPLSGKNVSIGRSRIPVTQPN